MQQIAGAASGDIGLTSREFPQHNCPPAQHACVAAAGDDEPELEDAYLDKLEFYMRTLAVPARRTGAAAQVARGERVFERSGCSPCHLPSLRTAGHIEPLLASQTFAPFTDLLLHDMGEGLADGRPDFAANGREWRTAPLWGVGLVPVVNGHSFYLHDGRARDLQEAILWHGGEAAASQAAFVSAPRDERSALLASLATL